MRVLDEQQGIVEVELPGSSAPGKALITPETVALLRRKGIDPASLGLSPLSENELLQDWNLTVRPATQGNGRQPAGANGRGR